MKKIWIAAALVALVGLGAYKLKDNKAKVAEKIYVQDPSLKVGVDVSKVTIKPVSQSLSFLGTFNANKEVEIKTQLGGEVLQVHFENGQSIRQGAILAKIDNEQLELQKEGLEISIEGYKNDLKRYQNLVAGDATPAVNVERTQLSIRSTEAQKRQIEKQIGHANVAAPFSGVITEKLTEKGAVVSNGFTIARLTDISRLKLRLMVPEKSINMFKVGQKLAVTTEVYPDQTFGGIVTMISAKGDASHNYPIELTVQNNNTQALRAGMYGSVGFDHTVSSDALTIPRQALVGSSKDPFVFVVTDGKASLRKITLGSATSEVFVVSSGLTEGESVVVSGQINLKDGSPVSIQ